MSRVANAARGDEEARRGDAPRDNRDSRDKPGGTEQGKAGRWARVYEELTADQLRLYEENIRLVRWVAGLAWSTSGLVRRRLSRDDCEGHAAIGLALACRGFDPSIATKLGTKFSTYATRSCFNHIRQAAYNSTLIHVPTRRQRDAMRGGGSSGDGGSGTGAGDSSGSGDAMAADAMRAMNQPRGLIGFDVHAAPGRPDEGGDHPELSGALSKLPPREQRVIALRFWDGHTLSQVASELGVTKERARQIEAAAIRQLRNALPSR